MELPYLQGMCDYMRLWNYPCCFRKRIMEGPYTIWTLHNCCHSVGRLHWPRASLVRCITACSLSFVSFKTVSFIKLLCVELSLLPRQASGFAGQVHHRMQPCFVSFKTLFHETAPYRAFLCYLSLYS